MISFAPGRVWRRLRVRLPGCSLLLASDLSRLISEESAMYGGERFEERLAQFNQPCQAALPFERAVQVKPFTHEVHL